MARFNFPVPEKVHALAKDAARAKGMLMRAWVAKAVEVQARREGIEVPYDRGTDTG
jgi:predicted HicB family RNase H-like nuclease